MIRTYIYIVLFSSALIFVVVERIIFEKKNKGKEPNEYIVLFRKHTLIMFLFFLVLLILQISKLADL